MTQGTTPADDAGPHLPAIPAQHRLYLIDTSAQARICHPGIREIIVALIADRVAATCVTVDLEVGFSGRCHEDVRGIAERRRELYQVLPITEAIADRAREVQVRLAKRGKHRAAGLVDLLTAAVAEHHDAVLLHYDEEFERIAAVTGQSQAWIAPPGSLER
ncbi:PIN domain-containing protein [Luedemannella helvata]|uniref:Ribonuclease VapC n=1 Tax=Luedemannella helvata TaxID=349315 RepID=A0ABP4W434_9ACTN